MLELLIIFVLLAANGFFAFSEICLVSSRKNRLAALAEKRVRGARTAIALREQLDQFLSAVQVGITLVGIVAGAFGGAAFAERLGVVFSKLPHVGQYGDTIAYVLIVAALTFLSVVIGELVPKQLAMTNPERLACLIAPPMRVIVKISLPAVWLLSTSSGMIIRLFCKHAQPIPHVTEEELVLTMDEAAKAGSIHLEEQQVAVRAFRFADRPVTSLMTARTDVIWLRKDEPMDKLLEKLLMSNHGRLPLCEGTIDNVVGLILQREAARFHILQNFSPDNEERAKQLEGLVHRPIFISETATGSQALEILRREKGHFAIIIDEYGGTVGVLSSHDILEALVGFVAGDTYDEEPIVRREDGSLLVEGWVTTSDVYSAHNLLCDREIEALAIAGFLINRMDRIPAVGEHFEEAGLRFEIVDKDGPRIDKVMVTRSRQAEEEKENGEGN